MTKLSTGRDSSLGEYLRICTAIFGEDSPATKFIAEKIKDSPNGEMEEVIADERQMVWLLTKMHIGETNGS
jgi:hypothetical protein